MIKKIAILGSTGSIGTQALDVVRQNPERFEAAVLACGRNIRLLRDQIREFHPRAVVVEREEDALRLQRENPRVDVLWGADGLIQASTDSRSDILLNALPGMRGLGPTHAAMVSGKDVALANKEAIVAGGHLIMRLVRAGTAGLIPVDSEHSAIFQCLASGKSEEVSRIILTASGGPFRGYTKERLAEVSVEQALNHPKWKMGDKITVDSATLMNKGLEVIEAKWLFDKRPDQIEVVVHPQSIIHSMVEYRDHSVIAQLGLPDMRIPISFALAYPDRLANRGDAIDFTDLGGLTFEKADTRTFSCLRLAYEVLQAGGSAPAALNAANEALVDLFLRRKIKFIDIQKNIHIILEEHDLQKEPSLSDIYEIDREVREKVYSRW